MVSDIIKSAIKEVCKSCKLNVAAGSIVLEHPALEEYGDYSTNIVLTLPKLPKSPKSPTSLKSLASPRVFAQNIVKELEKNPELKEIVQTISVAGPGFINFHLIRDVLLKELARVQEEKDQFGNGLSLNHKKVMIEFTDPNPFKEFHIGHLYSNIVGEAFSRLFESQGAMVKRANYQGDIGMHVAKSVWGMIQLIKEIPLESDTLDVKAKFLGKAYALGATKFEEDDELKKEMTIINKKIYDHDPDVMSLYTKGRGWSLDYFECIYQRLGVNSKKKTGKQFDFYYFESEVGGIGLEYVRKGLHKGIFQKSDGAVVFPGEKYGLHTRVFVNSLGLPTYEAKELGLAPSKYKDFPYDESFVVTGNEINEYFKVLLVALSLLEPKLAKKTHHVSHGMVRLPTGKMSSRTGKVLTGEWLLNEAKQKALGIMKKKDEKLADSIGLGAIKYALLKSGVGRDVAFDFDESVSFDGNSGPYLQYTYARCMSVLSKSGIAKYQAPSTKYSQNGEELAILRWIYRFPEIVEQATVQCAPNFVCTFLYELAQRFNTFYNKYQILEPNLSSPSSSSLFRIFLTASVAQTLKNGLYLLGVTAPTKM